MKGQRLIFVISTFAPRIQYIAPESILRSTWAELYQCYHLRHVQIVDVDVPEMAH